MLTPAFDLTQNDEFLIVSIQVPYAKISDVEVHFDETDFMFYSKPYYLRLTLPGKVLHRDEPSVKYDVDQKTFVVQVPKVTKGEVFEGLDLVTLLLKPKNAKPITAPLIEILETSEDAQESDEEFDWSVDQVPSDEQFGNLQLSGRQCGFASSYSYSVFSLKEEVAEIFDVTDPQTQSPKTLTEARLQAESSKFDEDHYLADLYQDDEIQLLIKYSPEWEALYEKNQNNVPDPIDDKVHFTSQEKERLRKLPNKEYLLDKSQAKAAFFGLIDILFAYAYNKRTTEGENTVESGWTINKLSATLSWLETFTSIQQVAVACIRRSISYPLFRHFELSVTVLEDVRKILMLGRKYVIKCLLEIHEMFCASEPRYILNDIFITDYIVWMQTKKCSTKKLVPLAEVLGKVLLTKGDIGLNLVDIESFAVVAWMSRDVLRRNSTSEKVKPTAAGNSGEPKNSHKTICSKLGKLSLVTNQNESDDESSASLLNVNRLGSEYEVCGSCTSDSSDSCSSNYETDSSVDSESDSDSEEDSKSSSDSDTFTRVLMRTMAGNRTA